MRDWKRYIAGAIAVAMVAGGSVLAAEGDMEVKVDYKPSFSIVIDGKLCGFVDASGKQVYPLVYEGSTYLPLRSIGNLMEKEVGWDAETETVTLSGEAEWERIVPVGQRPADSQVQAVVKPGVTVVVDGKEQNFVDANGKTVYPIIYNGSTYLPLRAIGNLMGKEVGWNGELSTVFLGDQADGESIAQAEYVMKVYRCVQGISQVVQQYADLDVDAQPERVLEYAKAFRTAIAAGDGLTVPKGLEQQGSAFQAGVTQALGGADQMIATVEKIGQMTTQQAMDANYVQQLQNELDSAANAANQGLSAMTTAAGEMQKQLEQLSTSAQEETQPQETEQEA